MEHISTELFSESERQTCIYEVVKQGAFHETIRIFLEARLVDPLFFFPDYRIGGVILIMCQSSIVFSHNKPKNMRPGRIHYWQKTSRF